MDAATDPTLGKQSERESVQRLLRLLATVGAALMLVVIVASASLRLSQAGLSCADWPVCYGHVEAQALLTTGMQMARLAHRVAASSVGIILLGALLIGAAQRPRPRRQVAIAGAALATALVLAAIGASFSASSAELPSPAVMLANLAGGFALLALLWWLRLSTLPASSSERSPSWLRFFAALALAVAIVEVLLGGLVSARFAALACPAFPGCGADWSAGALLQSVNPFAERAMSPDGMILRTPMLAALHWTHRVGALAVLVLGATLAIGMISASQHLRRAGVLLAALLTLQLALGAAMIETRFPLALALAHNLCAALLLTALITANRALYVDTASP